MPYKTAVLIGRFSPYHLGHKALIERALELGDRLLILIGSTEQARSLRNPFTFEERYSMIADDQRSNASRITILSLPDDPYDMQAWIKRVQDAVRIGTADRNSDVVLIGSEKDARTSQYLNLFPQWKLVTIDAHAPDGRTLDATSLRDAYFDIGDATREETDGILVGSKIEEIKHMIPSSTQQFLLKFAINGLLGNPTSESFRGLRREMKFAKSYRTGWRYADHPSVPPIFVTVDAVVWQAGHVILVKRRDYPGKGLGALPGGFLNAGEELVDGAIRELREETSIDVPEGILRNSIKASYVFDTPHRSSRGRVISHGFLFDLDGEYMSRGMRRGKHQLAKIVGSDDAEKASWIPVNELDPRRMFEDHFFITKRMLSMRGN